MKLLLESYRVRAIQSMMNHFVVGHSQLLQDRETHNNILIAQEKLRTFFIHLKVIETWGSKDQEQAKKRNF